MEEIKVTTEEIRTQCVVVTKAVIELRVAQQHYYRCYRDNPRKSEYLAESKMKEHQVDAEIVKYQWLCEKYKNQQEPTQEPTEEPTEEPSQEQADLAY